MRSVIIGTCFTDAGTVDDGEWAATDPRTTLHRPHGKNCYFWVLWVVLGIGIGYFGVLDQFGIAGGIGYYGIWNDSARTTLRSPHGKNCSCFSYFEVLVLTLRCLHC